MKSNANCTHRVQLLVPPGRIHRGAATHLLHRRLQATRGTPANISYKNMFGADIWLWMPCLNINIFHDGFTAGKNEIHLFFLSHNNETQFLQDSGGEGPSIKEKPIDYRTKTPPESLSRFQRPGTPEFNAKGPLNILNLYLDGAVTDQPRCLEIL